MAKRRILMDVDTGVDDACAIALAAASDDLEILGITTCMGNLVVDETTKNTLDLVEHLGLSVPVAKGSDVPLVRERWVNDKEVTTLPIKGLKDANMKPSNVDAVTFMADVLEKADGKVTLVPLAPLTNIAKLMIFYPLLVEEKVDEIVLMGGGWAGGNITAAAELNFYADPEAAQTVFNFGTPIVMCGLEICRKSVIKESDNRLFKNINTLPAKVFSECVDSWLGSFRKKGSGDDGYVVIYDSVPILYLLHPEIFESVEASVQIETISRMCDGMSVCDTREINPALPNGEVGVGVRNATVLLDVDRDKFISLIEEILKEGK